MQQLLSMGALPSTLSSRAKPRDLRFSGPFVEMFFDRAERSGEPALSEVERGPAVQPVAPLKPSIPCCTLPSTSPYQHEDTTVINRRTFVKTGAAAAYLATQSNLVYAGIPQHPTDI